MEIKVIMSEIVVHESNASANLLWLFKRALTLLKTTKFLLSKLSWDLNQMALKTLKWYRWKSCYTRCLNLWYLRIACKEPLENSLNGSQNDEAYPFGTIQIYISGFEGNNFETKDYWIYLQFFSLQLFRCLIQRPYQQIAELIFRLVQQWFLFSVCVCVRNLAQFQNKKRHGSWKSFIT